MTTKTQQQTTSYVSSYIDTNKPNHINLFSDTLLQYLKELLPYYNNQLVLVCIGTDRATGDSLGPLVGYKLLDIHFDNLIVYGTLDCPVHAKNLEDTLQHIGLTHPKALVISIDACLGDTSRIGQITIGEGGLKPGIGVKKDLPLVGNLHIMGIVNFTSHMNMAILQNTRLSVVMRMADTIAIGIQLCMHKYNTYLQEKD